MEVTNYPQQENNQGQNTSNNTNPGTPPQENKKTLAGIFGILLGALGIHKFYLGYTKEGLIMLLVSVLTCGFGASIMGVIGLIEGIMYLTKSDEDFYNTYQLNQKGWF